MTWNEIEKALRDKGISRVQLFDDGKVQIETSRAKHIAIGKTLEDAVFLLDDKRKDATE